MIRLIRTDIFYIDGRMIKKRYIGLIRDHRTRVGRIIGERVGEGRHGREGEVKG